jgi:hypothetical protein
MKPGDKVKVHYKDSVGTTLLWSGTIKEQVGDNWRVDVGGVAIVFNPADIEVTDEKADEGPHVNQG